MTRINLKRLANVLAIFCTLFSVASLPPTASGRQAAAVESQRGTTVQPDQAIQILIDKTLRGSKLPGLVAAIAKPDRPLRVAAGGIRKSKQSEPMTIFDQVHLGSCTKSITASMLARLVERNVLSWDMTIKQALPELCEDIHADYHDVTLSQLTMHYGAMPANAGNWWLSGGKDITQRRELIAAETLVDAPKYKPGTKYLYSNLGYMVAGLMAARTTGISWEQLIRREVFEPLDLKTAGFGAPGTQGDIAQPWGHVIWGKNKLVPMQRDNAPALGPAGTIHMSINDWARFCLQHALTDGNPFLSAESIQELHKPDPKSRYAKGWIVINKRDRGTILAHSGSNKTWYATVWISLPSKTVYLAATNVAGDGIPKTIDSVLIELVRLDQ
jgi:CubicO group peptidase (beta-lactamase class C family)